MKHIFYSLALVVFLSHCRPRENPVIMQFPGKPQVPASIKKEHEYLLDRMHQLTLFDDSTGRAAVPLNELMQHHFGEEEDYVLPPLGLLPMLAKGQMPDETEKIIALTDKLKEQYNHISAEHQMIKALMDELKQIAVKENHAAEIIEFDNELLRHAAAEEEIYFPAAILVGEYLKANAPQGNK